ncbi:uncharacterized protein MONBRDRAFT_27860 [Monosiga brevicollis MX1]|uniref:Uncharacterized protein n=1 Tax=Monosiga brevicollis TaxID=81824 RepID=A9V6P2_MONBE|nr:uncharacterized protein MONBRDRAFT_27860 [Monosiga brevicollis MX1]EDQ86769.1 predicted protein [Monosiga brevicollis MX1]|eukprot:XP_001748314.1 hypothetical protein [Monosiga brevicollis MX1]
MREVKAKGKSPKADPTSEELKNLVSLVLRALNRLPAPSNVSMLTECLLTSLSSDTLAWEAVRPNDPNPTVGRYDHASYYDTALQELVVLLGAGVDQALADLRYYDRCKSLDEPWPLARIRPRVLKSPFFPVLTLLGDLCEAKRTWTLLKATGTSPSPRTCHSWAEDDANLYVFCGGESGTTPCADQKLYRFSKADRIWSLCTSEHSPAARQAHAMALSQDVIYVHGGMMGQEWLDDFWCYRDGDGRLVLFGGLAMTVSGPEALDDLWLYDPATNKWQEVEFENAPVAARFDFASLMVDHRCWYHPGATDAPQSNPTASRDTQPVGLQDVTEQFGAVVEGAATTAPPQPEDSQPDNSPAPSPSSPDTPAVPLPSHHDTLVLYGGMDMQGNVHSDCVVIRLA